MILSLDFSTPCFKYSLSAIWVRCHSRVKLRGLPHMSQDSGFCHNEPEVRNKAAFMSLACSWPGPDLCQMLECPDMPVDRVKL